MEASAGRRRDYVSVGFNSVAYIAYGVGIIFGFWERLIRPKPVSSKAKYVSIIEEGVWFDCSIDSRLNVNVCTAWNYDGRLLITGEFRLKGQDRAATKDELYPSALEPNRIYLFDGPGHGNIWTRYLERLPDGWEGATLPQGQTR